MLQLPVQHAYRKTVAMVADGNRRWPRTMTKRDSRDRDRRERQKREMVVRDRRERQKKQMVERIGSVRWWRKMGGEIVERDCSGRWQKTGGTVMWMLKEILRQDGEGRWL